MILVESRHDDCDGLYLKRGVGMMDYREVEEAHSKEVEYTSDNTTWS